jgi:hypothetical protein
MHENEGGPGSSKLIVDTDAVRFHPGHEFVSLAAHARGLAKIAHNAQRTAMLQEQAILPTLEQQRTIEARPLIEFNATPAVIGA